MDTAIRWVNSFFILYTILILVRIILSWITLAPIRRSSQAVLQFVHDTTGWYLSFFRRIIPPIGPLDLSAIVALIVLGLVHQFVVRILLGV